MRFILVLLFIILFASCTQTKEELHIPDDLETIQVNLEEAGILKMSDFISDIKYIPLETPDGRPLGRIRKFLINDSYLGFYDQAIYTVIEANDLLRHLNELYENEPEKYADPRMERVRELGYSLNDNSNPILQIASLKDE